MTDDARLPEAPHAVRLDTEAESGGGRETGGACLRAVPADATAIEPESPPHRFPLGGGRMTDDARLSEAPHAVRLDTEAESGGGRETGGACLRAVPADATAIEPESPPHRFPLGGGRMTGDARLSEAPHAVRLDTEAESGGGPVARDTRLPEALSAALRAVRVDVTAAEAELADRRVTAEDARQLTGVLADALYASLHAGLPESSAPSQRLRDPQLEEALAREVPHTTYPSDAELIGSRAPGSGAGRQVVVRTGGVAVAVPGAWLTGPAEDGRPVRLAWPAAHPAVSPGFFFVTGSQGPPPRQQPLLRVYLHVRDADAAPGLFGRVLRALEAGGRPYRAKAASVPHQYPRYDAVVVYLAAEDRALLDLVAHEVAGHPALGEETSLFARRHAPGVASAAEPGDPRPGMRGMSFGQHRSHVMAQALVEHATTGRGESLDVLLARRLAEARIDPCDPARNLTA